ncbi:MAG: hypothetical protein QM571_01215 [Micrococcaceae bacterium]
MVLFVGTAVMLIAIGKLNIAIGFIVISATNFALAIYWKQI